MSFRPQTIIDLGAYWTRQGGVNLGIVGSAGHTRGYHLGKDRIFASTGQGWRDYSVATARDKAGLSNAAAALDLGRLDGSLTKLFAFNKWLVGRCRANAPGTRDVREVIYTADGHTVLRWDRQRGYASAPRTGESDSSHLWHTHISFYRDSEGRAKVGLFEPYFAAAPGEVPMPTITTYIPGHLAVIRHNDGARVRAEPTLAAATLRTIPATSSETWEVTGWVKGDVAEGNDQWITRWAGGKWEYTHKSNVVSVVEPTVDCADAVAAAVGPLNTAIGAANATITDLQGQVAAANDAAALAAGTERERIARAEANRILAI